MIKINIEIPIIDNILDLNIFKVSGDTKTLYDDAIKKK